MPKRPFVGGSGGRRGFTGFVTSLTTVDFLGVVPDQPSMLLLVGDKGDWCIRSDLNTVFIVTNVPSSLIGNWQQLAYPTDPAKVLASAADPNPPDYLDGKLAVGSGIRKTLAYLGATVNLNTVVDPDLAWGNPVVDFYDPTSGLPVSPSDKERHIASLDGSGWYKDHIYEYDVTSAVWRDIAPVNGLTVYDLATKTVYIYDGATWVLQVNDTDPRLTDDRFPTAHATTHDVNGSDEILPLFYLPVIAGYNPIGGLPVLPATGDRYIAGMTSLGWTVARIYEYDGAAWVETIPRTGASILVKGNTVAPHNVDALVGGAVYAWTGVTWAITKYAGTLLIDANDNKGSGFIADKLWGNDGVIVQNAVGDGRIRFDAKVDGVTLDLVGSTPKSIAVKNLGITDAKVSASAGIAESKLALNYATHSNANDPSAGEKAALPGTSGTPGAANKYVTDGDARNTNARTPTGHHATHEGGSDAMTVDAAAGTGSLRTLGSGLTATLKAAPGVIICEVDNASDEAAAFAAGAKIVIRTDLL